MTTKEKDDQSRNWREKTPEPTSIRRKAVPEREPWSASTICNPGSRSGQKKLWEELNPSLPTKRRVKQAFANLLDTNPPNWLKESETSLCQFTDTNPPVWEKWTQEPTRPPGRQSGWEIIYISLAKQSPRIKELAAQRSKLLHSNLRQKHPNQRPGCYKPARKARNQ